MEGQCRFTWVSDVLEKQRCHFMHFLAHSPGSASLKEDAGSGKAEEAGEDSILDALSPLPDEFSLMPSEEYDR